MLAMYGLMRQQEKVLVELPKHTRASHLVLGVPMSS